MNCTSCGRSLPGGVAFCPVCGAATPYNMSGQGSGSQYNPTEASPYGNGSPQNYPPLPPTIAANAGDYPPQPQNPYTSYGAGMPQMPQQAPYDPYNTPPAYPVGSPPPPANPMGSGPYYGTPPMSAYPPGMQPGGMYGVPPKKSSKVGLIIGISVLAVLLLCGGLIVVATQIGKSTTSTANSSTSATATTSTDNTPTTGTTSTNGAVPTNASVVPAAAKILFGLQTSNGVNANYDPTNVTTTFSTGKDVDLTFQVDSAGKNGYIKVRWYEDGQEVTSDILAHHATNNHGYFGQPYSTAGNGAVALYWCTKADCSDEQLAQVVNFTVTGTATVPSTNTTIAMASWKRNND